MREYVESSSVDWYEYGARERTIDVRYVGGGVYRYFDVPLGVYEQLRSAPSKGRFVNEVVKKRYRCARLNPR